MSNIIPRKFYSSPLRFCLGLSLILLVLINVFLYQTNHHSLPSQFYDQTKNSESGNGYLVSPGTTVQGLVDDAYDPQFWESFAKEIKESKKEEILQNIKDELFQENYTNLLQEIKQSVRNEKYEEFSNQLKFQIELDYTKKYVESSKKSYTFIEEMKQEYLEKHAQELKSQLTGEIATQYNRKLFYEFIFEDILMAAAPEVVGFNAEEIGDELKPSNQNDMKLPRLSSDVLSRHLKVNHLKYRDLKEKHENFIKLISNLQPPPFFKGEGIIIHAHKDIVNSIAILKQIREMGSEMPVEFVIEKPIKRLCEKLNTLKAKCIVLSEELGESLIEKLQQRNMNIKCLGLLVSSFAHIVSLESSLPLKIVDELLQSSLYTKSKWMVFPSIHQRVISPIYYQISGIRKGEPIRRSCLPNEVNFSDYLSSEKKNVCLHDLDGLPNTISSDSSQMVFSKRDHYHSFLLALYYNLFNEFYYPLLYQSTEKSDRETWVAALHAMNEPYYINKYLPSFFKSEQNEPYFFQFDPQESKKFFDDWEDHLLLNRLDTRLSPFQKNEFTQNLFDSFGQTHRKTQWFKKTLPNGQEGYSPINAAFKNPDLYFMDLNKLHPEDDKEIVQNSELEKEKWDRKFLETKRWVICDFMDEQLWHELGKNKQEQCKN